MEAYLGAGRGCVAAFRRSCKHTALTPHPTPHTTPAPTDALASLDVAFASVSSSQTRALAAVDGLLEELASVHDAAAPLPPTVAAAADAARSLRARAAAAEAALAAVEARLMRVRAVVEGREKV